jgi:REP element-mobilizing transposase RayT
MSNLTPEAFYRRNLPHIQPPGKELFVTSRLTGSIPWTILDALRREAERVQAEIDSMTHSPERAERIYREQRRLFGKWDDALDAGSGPDYLRNPAVAEIVAENLRHFDGQRYDLLAYCIMANHVHAVFRPLPKTKSDGSGEERVGGAVAELDGRERKSRKERKGMAGEKKGIGEENDGEEYYSLSQIMHTMKGFTAGRANRALGRTGAFWQHESYDHYARDGAELERIVAYVIGNPVKAKMVERWEDWPWTYVTPLALSR